MVHLVRNGVGAAIMLGVALLLAGCGGSSSTPTALSDSYDANRLVIHDFIGTLTIETAPAGEAIGLHVDATTAQLALLPVTQDGNTLTISWNGEPDRKRRWYEFWRGRWMFEMRDLDNYPTMVLTVPADVAIDIDGLIGRWTIGDREGDLTVGAERGEGTIGATQTANISVSGDAEVTFGPVADYLHATVAGSGSLFGGMAGRADLSVAGSGRLVVGDVAGALSVNVAGSGQVTTGSAASLEASVSGSGVVQLGAVADGFHASVQGSGSVGAAVVNGAFSVSVSGSGSVRVDEGRASPFNVTIAGSGSVRFAGTGVDPVVRISGSGRLVLGFLEGELDQDIAGNGGVRLLNP